jgi:hypothetical protein
MGKSGRRVQANARTLSYAVRQYFRPGLREIQPAASTSNSLDQASTSAAGAATEPTQDAVSSSSSPTPEDQLIPTQPAEEAPAVQQSEKSLGKRKRVETATTGAADQRGIQTRFTQANIPPALKKCESIVSSLCWCSSYAEALDISADWHQRYRLFSRYDEGIQMDYDGA